MKKMNKEIRCFQVEMKAIDSEENKMIIEGYPVVFESPATHGFTEIIDRKALDSCDMSDVPLKYNHTDNHLIMARTRNNSLELKKDEKGLYMRAELLDTTSNIDVYKAIKAGLLDKMSFAFTVNEDSYDYDTDTRRILSINKLYDVSVVDMPFYDSTSLYARGIDNADDFMERRKELRKQHESELERKQELDKEKKELLEKLG